MLSVVMPYWQRQSALDTGLASMAKMYPDMNLEMVVVDDGSPEPARADGIYPWPVRIIRLPSKTTPKSACVPYNAGVKAAYGDLICLSAPEILHQEPVFPKMIKALNETGPRGYVAAAAWCPEHGMWHCHSTSRIAEEQGYPHPQGFGMHFCAVIHRDFYLSVGGFDEAYRDGSSFDDNDFVWTLHDAGAIPSILDECVVIHAKTGATTQWPEGSHERNRQIFLNKWGHKQ
jgi:hypothetical protein